MVSLPFFFCQLGTCSILNVALREEWMGTRNGEESFSRCLMRSMKHLKDLGLLRELGHYKQTTLQIFLWLEDTWSLILKGKSSQFIIRCLCVCVVVGTVVLSLKRIKSLGRLCGTLIRCMNPEVTLKLLQTSCELVVSYLPSVFSSVKRACINASCWQYVCKCLVGWS